MAWHHPAHLRRFGAFVGRDSRAASSGADALRGIYQEHFAAVNDLALRLAPSESAATKITRATFARLVEDDLVRANADVAGSLLATAYHEAVTRGARATQPVAAGTHALSGDQLASVNSHVARCRACRRWGALPYLGPAVNALRPHRAELKDRVWREIAPPVTASRPPDTATEGRGKRRFATRHVVFGAACGVLLAAAVGIGAMLISSGGDAGDGVPAAVVAGAARDDSTPQPSRDTDDTTLGDARSDGAVVLSVDPGSSDALQPDAASNLTEAIGNARTEDGSAPDTLADGNEWSGQSPSGESRESDESTRARDDASPSDAAPPASGATTQSGSDSPASPSPSEPPAAPTAPPRASPTASQPPPVIATATPVPQLLPLLPTVASALQTVIPLDLIGD